MDRFTFAIDNGTLNTRVAAAVDDEVEQIFKETEIPLTTLPYFWESRACRLRQNSAIIGDAALQAWKKDLSSLGISWALKNGTINNEETMTALWLTGMEEVQKKMKGLPKTKAIGEEKSDELDLVVTEKSLTPKALRERVTKIAFGSILPRDGRFYLANDATMSLYATGRTTGLITETGFEQTDVVPIYEGYSLPHAIDIHKFDNSDMTGKSAMRYLSKVIFDQTGDESFSKDKWECQIPFLESLLKTQVRVFAKNEEEYPSWLKSIESMPIKEASDVARFSDLLYGRAVSDYGRHLPSDLTHLLSQMYGFDLPYSRIRLPDSKESVLLGKEKYGVFEREGCPYEEGSKGHMEWRSLTQLGKLGPVYKTDLDIRRDLSSNIVVTGGLCNIQGLPDRLESLAEKYKINHSMKGKVIPGTRVCPAGAAYTSVHGSQILAGLTTFQEMYITRAEFNESGPGIVHRKCF